MTGADHGPSTLTTERTILRAWRVDEARHYLDILGRREVTKWLGGMEPIPDLDTARHNIEIALEASTPQVPGGRAIVPHDVGHPVGTVLLSPLPDDVEVQVGWHLHPDHTGRGWTTEAAHAVIDDAFTQGHRRVWANMWPNNAASIAVAARLGMTDLGEQVDPWYGSIEYPTSRMFCNWKTDRPDDLDPVAVLEDRVAKKTFEHATDHPPA